MKEKIFEALCRDTIYSCPHDCDTFTAKELAIDVGCTIYAARKALHELRDEGLVQNKSMGRPAVESFNGECYELVCDAMPPKNGFALTSKGASSDVYKRILDQWTKELADWANGYEECE